MRWANALIRSVIWLGGAGLYAYLKKPDGFSVLDVRPDAVGWLGVGLVGAGVVLHGWSNVVLARHDPAPGLAATLAATGPFRIVRNPIYLAGIVLLTGVGLLYRSWHIKELVLPGVLFVYFHLAIVRVEEPALRRLFGANYDAYCRRVPRWLPGPTPGNPQ